MNPSSRALVATSATQTHSQGAALTPFFLEGDPIDAQAALGSFIQTVKTAHPLELVNTPTFPSYAALLSVVQQLEEENMRVGEQAMEATQH